MTFKGGGEGLFVFEGKLLAVLLSELVSNLISLVCNGSLNEGKGKSDH